MLRFPYHLWWRRAPSGLQDESCGCWPGRERRRGSRLPLRAVGHASHPQLHTQLQCPPSPPQQMAWSSKSVSLVLPHGTCVELLVVGGAIGVSWLHGTACGLPGFAGREQGASERGCLHVPGGCVARLRPLPSAAASFHRIADFPPHPSIGFSLCLCPRVILCHRTADCPPHPSVGPSLRPHLRDIPTRCCAISYMPCLLSVIAAHAPDTACAGDTSKKIIGHADPNAQDSVVLGESGFRPSL